MALKVTQTRSRATSAASPSSEAPSEPSVCVPHRLAANTLPDRPGDPRHDRPGPAPGHRVGGGFED